MTAWPLLDAHAAVLPVLLPALTAMALLFIGDQGTGMSSPHGHHRMLWARRLSIASASLGLVLAAALLVEADGGALRVYRLGDWPAPFGIVLVVDRLAALMLLLGAVIALPVLAYASGGWDARGRHFHALFQFQLMGLNGAFVTGDLFNLFVFFEVLLIASYVLLLHGHGRARLRAGLHYVVLNLAASALFLIGVALVYALTGTLNLAELGLRAPRVTGPEAAVLQAAALLLLVVFAFKAALVPLAMWLPSTYAAASPPVAALFAIMTKVGVYAIVRVHGVAFGDGATAGFVQPLLLGMGIATCALGGAGALAAHSLPRLVSWLNVASVGTLVLALALFEPAAWSGALYYLAHSTLVIAGLFLLSELVAAQRGDVADRLEPASPVAQPALLGTLLLLAAASVTGLPPMPGFIGKLMILQASSSHAAAAAVWTTVLGLGFVTLVGLARAGSILFWNVRPDRQSARSGTSGPLLAATASVLAAGVAMALFAGPVTRYTAAAAAQLGERAAYARAVLGGEPADTVRPYRGDAAAPAASGEKR